MALNPDDYTFISTLENTFDLEQLINDAKVGVVEDVRQVMGSAASVAKTLGQMETQGAMQTKGSAQTTGTMRTDGSMQTSGNMQTSSSSSTSGFQYEYGGFNSSTSSHSSSSFQSQSSFQSNSSMQSDSSFRSDSNLRSASSMQSVSTSATGYCYDTFLTIDGKRYSYSGLETPYIQPGDVVAFIANGNKLLYLYNANSEQVEFTRIRKEIANPPVAPIKPREPRFIQIPNFEKGRVLFNKPSMLGSLFFGVAAAFVLTYIPILLIHWIGWGWSWGTPAVFSLIIGLLIAVLGYYGDRSNHESEEMEKLRKYEQKKADYEKKNQFEMGRYERETEQYKRDREIYEKAEAEYKEKCDKLEKCWSELNEKVTQTAIEADEKLANLQLKGDKKKQIE